VALVLLVTAGCSEDDSPTAGITGTTVDGTAGGGSSATTAAPSAAATTAPSVNTASGACKYVTTAEATSPATSPVKPGVSRSLTSGPVPFEYCDFIFDPGNSPGVTVAVADLAGNGPGLFAQSGSPNRPAATTRR